MRFLGLCLLANLAIAPAPPSPPVARGQSLADVKAKLGPPLRINRQILFSRHIDQLVYEEPQPIWVELNCVRGDEPYVCAILQLPPPLPGSK